MVRTRRLLSQQFKTQQTGHMLKAAWSVVITIQNGIDKARLHQCRHPKVRADDAAAQIVPSVLIDTGLKACFERLDEQGDRAAEHNKRES
jgi:hypothetical protein